MSDEPTGDTTALPFQAMSREQLFNVACQLEQELASERIVRRNAEGDRDNAFRLCREARDQRDAAESKFIAVRAENDDLQEEVAHLTKQLAAARKVADERHTGQFTFRLGLIIGGLVGVAIGLIAAAKIVAP